MMEYTCVCLTLVTDLEGYIIPCLPGILGQVMPPQDKSLSLPGDSIPGQTSSGNAKSCSVWHDMPLSCRRHATVMTFRCDMPLS